MQYRHEGYQNRNRIKTSGGAKWLTVPINHRDRGKPIYEIRISDAINNRLEWWETHLETLRHNYGRAPYYDKYIQIIEEVYREQIKLLSDLNIALLKAMFMLLNIPMQIKRTSEMHLDHTFSSKTESIIQICKEVGAESYVSGPIGTRYIDGNLFDQNGIQVLYPVYHHPTYKQRFMKLGFIPNMSIVDILFNHGPESVNIIKSGFKGFTSKNNFEIASCLTPG